MHRIEISKLFGEFVSKYEIVCDACEIYLIEIYKSIWMY